MRRKVQLVGAYKTVPCECASCVCSKQESGNIGRPAAASNRARGPFYLRIQVGLSRALCVQHAWLPLTLTNPVCRQSYLWNPLHGTEFGVADFLSYQVVWVPRVVFAITVQACRGRGRGERCPVGGENGRVHVQGRPQPGPEDILRAIRINVGGILRFYWA